MEDIVRRFVNDFGPDAASWYLLGSYADGSAIDLSDIDLLCLFRKSLGVTVYEWGATTERSYKGQVDIYMQHPQSINTVLNAHVLAMLDRGVLIDGLEQRGLLPAINLRAYQETVAHLFGRAVEHYHPDRNLALNPDPEDEFLGFVERAPLWTQVATWTHPIVVLLGNAARAVASLDGGIAATRGDAVDLFMKCDGCREWPAFTADALALLRASWRYRVPEARVDRGRLRDVCAKLCRLEEFCVGVMSEAGMPIFRVTRS